MNQAAAIVSGTGVFLPSQRITNQELVASFNAFVDSVNPIRSQVGAPLLEYSDVDFIFRASGIKQRFVLDRTGVLDPGRMTPVIPERANTDISVQAEFGMASARLALDRAGRAPEEVDLTICACAHHQRPYPAIAIEIQKGLGCRGGAFDMNVACSSVTFALHVASSLVCSGAAKTVLVVSPEIMSGHLNFRDRQTHFIFGDASASVLIERAGSSAMPANTYQVIDSRIWTDYSSNIRSNFGFLNRAADKQGEAADNLVTQNGHKVFKEVTRATNLFIREFLADRSLCKDQIKRYWLHQANLRMLESLAEELFKRPASPTEMPITLDKYGNVASPGAIVAFDEHKDDLAIGDIGLLCSFGAGYSIGGLLLQKVT
jgi:beta-ketodecanoyl-[acyl-carrier-protein] synthase